MTDKVDRGLMGVGGIAYHCVEPCCTVTVGIRAIAEIRVRMHDGRRMYPLLGRRLHKALHYRTEGEGTAKCTISNNYRKRSHVRRNYFCRLKYYGGDYFAWGGDALFVFDKFHIYTIAYYTLFSQYLHLLAAMLYGFSG